MKKPAMFQSKVATTTAVLAFVVAFCTAWALILPAITLTGGNATEEEGFYPAKGQDDSSQPAAAADSASQPSQDALKTEAAGHSADSESNGGRHSNQADSSDDGSSAVEGMPEQDFVEKTDLGDGVVLEVRVQVESGVLPAGAKMNLDEILDENHLDLMKEQAEAKADLSVDESRLAGTDINFEDAKGNAIEPAGKMLVTFTCSVIEPKAQFAIAHVQKAKDPADPDDKDEAEIVKKLKKSEPEENYVQFEATDTDPYAIVYIPPSNDANEESDDGKNDSAADGNEDNADSSETKEMPAQSFAGSVKAEDGSTVDVSVEAEDGAFPAGSTMQVAQVADDDVINAAKEEAADRAGMADEAVRALAVDISFKDSNGNAVEPAKPVRVAMSSQEISRQDSLAVVHVDDNQNAQIMKDSDSKSHEGTVLFDAESFSVYAVVYTVDFHYELDGKTFEFNMAGGDAMSLSDLLAVLHITRSNDSSESKKSALNEEGLVGRVAEDTASAASNKGKVEKPLASDFIADVATVEFTDESLMKVARIDNNTTVGELKKTLGVEPEYSGELTEEDIANINAKTLTAPDWALLSLKAFDTDEVLTVTLRDGEKFEIKITDQSGGQWEVWFDGLLGQSSQANNRFYEGASNVRATIWPNQQVTLPGVGEWVNGQQVTAPSKYDYRLNGWYEVTGTGWNKKANWHAVGEHVTITKDTVFYADWVPASYSKGPSGSYINTPDTSEFVTTELFDYNELINVYFTSNPGVSVARPPYSPWNAPNVHSETWNANGAFAFISWNYNGRPVNSIGMPGNLQSASQYHPTDLTTGIYGSNADTIGRLFDGSDMVGKTAVGTGNYLFNYNEATDTYYYDSDLNATTYDQGAGRFYVYNDGEYISSGSDNLTNFLPYNDYPGGSAVDQNTGATNYWFGMKNTIDFRLPDDVGTPGNPSDNKDKNGQDMTFRFSGDDDVWVFVDDQLVLDLGGIHNRATGTINFATGEVTTYFGTLDHQQTTPVTTTSAALQSLREGNHTLKVLYLERGSSFSNCSIYFNLLPAPKISVEKEIVGTAAEIEEHKNQEFSYEVRVGENAQSAVPYNTPANPKDRQKVIKTKQDGTTELITITNGQVTLKHGERITIQDLQKNTNVYVSELNTSSMSQFEAPKATHTHQQNTVGIDLSEVTNQSGAIEGWTTTGDYNPGNTDVITFQNTVKKRTNLKVEKIWEGGAAPEGASLDVVVKRYKLVDSQPPTGTHHQRPLHGAGKRCPVFGHVPYHRQRH